MTPAMITPENQFDVDAMLGNCRQYWLNFSNVAQTDGPFSIYRTGVRHPQLNGVIQIRQAAPDSIAKVVRRLSDMPSLWWISSDSYEGASQDVASAGGKLIAKIPVMAVQLSDLVSKVKMPTDCSIKALADGDDLGPWVECFSKPMGVAAEAFEAMLDAERSRSDMPGQLTRFAARIGEDIVGTSQLFVHEGIAGIYLVATRKDRRRLGIGTALTHAACIAGLKHGLEVATLQASSSGYPVYRTLGFRDVAAYDLFTFPKAPGLTDNAGCQEGYRCRDATRSGTAAGCQRNPSASN